MTNTPARLDGLRELLGQLVGHDNALVRSAVRLSLDELDRADLADDPGPHLEQVTRILDAILDPDDGEG